MKKEKQPDDAFKENAASVLQMSVVYASASMLQKTKCGHGAECASCQRASDNLNYFAVLFGIIAGAAIGDDAAELYDVLTVWAKDNLPGFPNEIAGRGLYEADNYFPSVIEEYDNA